MLPNQRIFAQDLTTCATSKTVSLGTKNQARHKNTQELTQQLNQSLQLNLVFHELRYKHCKASKKPKCLAHFCHAVKYMQGELARSIKQNFDQEFIQRKGLSSGMLIQLLTLKAYILVPANLGKEWLTNY